MKEQSQSERKMEKKRFGENWLKVQHLKKSYFTFIIFFDSFPNLLSCPEKFRLPFSFLWISLIFPSALTVIVKQLLEEKTKKKTRFHQLEKLEERRTVSSGRVFHCCGIHVCRKGAHLAQILDVQLADADAVDESESVMMRGEASSANGTDYFKK